MVEERVIESNIAVASGEVVSEFEFSHEIYGEKFYSSQISTMRRSGVYDIIPIMVSERIIDVKESWVGKIVKISGQFRSYNKHEDGKKSRLILQLFARGVDVLQENSNENYIFLEGYTCRKIASRETPLGRIVADMIVAVNRPYGKSDYIPCICWGRNAVYAEDFEVGEHIQIEGRMQSREYEKVLEDGEYENRIAYEVSVSKVVVLEEMGGNTDESRD